MTEKIIIVNEKDEIIGYKERGNLEQKDIYRVSALWITNSKGDVLLAQRKFTKKNDPGKWGPAVAGTNDESETYESNILKEAEEELGLKNIKFKKSIHDFKEGEHRHFTQWFKVIINKEISEFKIQEEELEQIKWFTQEELKEAFAKEPEKFISGLKELFNKINLL